MAVPYFPAGYGSSYGMQYGMPQPYTTGIGIPGTVPNPSQGNQNGLIIAWVQGIAAMKSFSMGPNQKAFLFNTEENNFGIKSTDANGMPYPLEIFRYERDSADQRQPQPVQQQVPVIDTSAFVTREELEARIASIMRSFESSNQTNTNNLNNNFSNKSNNQNQNRGDQKHGK
jgi:hypothetical protein